jgi:hypothetical protein
MVQKSRIQLASHSLATFDLDKISLELTSGINLTHIDELFLIKHDGSKTFGGADVRLHAFVISSPDGLLCPQKEFLVPIG